MEYLLALDGGTSNTRLALLKDGKTLDVWRSSVGAGMNAQTPGVLPSAVKDGISELLSRNQLAEKDITAIVASGMVTAEIGLYALPHLLAPIDEKALCDGLSKVSLPEVTSIPFLFVAGVKTDGEELSQCDMMRGEETELVGLFEGVPKNTAVVLPGSHSKLIVTDDEARICSIKTTLTGEMLAALSANTVLRGSFSLADASVCYDALEEGYLYCRENGIGDALFKVRVLKLRLGYSPDQLYSFMLGVILESEISMLLRQNVATICIGGKKQLRDAMLSLLKPRTQAELRSFTEDAIGESVYRGLYHLYQMYSAQNGI